MFPGVVDRLQNAAAIEVTGKDGTLRMVRAGSTWGDADRAGYPVQQQRVRELLAGVSELRLVEPRTADPAQLRALNLDDPGPESSALRLAIRDGAGVAIAEAIVGRRRVRMQGNVPEAIYVRRPGETQAWLAEGTLRLDAERSLWVDRELLDIKRPRVAAATFRQGDQELALRRATPDVERLDVVAPPDGWRGDEARVDDVARALEWLTLEDVAPAAQVAAGTPLGTAQWTLFDGTRIDARIVEHDGTRWVGLDVGWSAPATPAPEGSDHRTPQQAEAEARAASQRLQGWVYRLPDWKLGILLSSIETLRAAEAPPPPAGRGSGN
jgi:hypothetical protein